MKRILLALSAALLVALSSCGRDEGVDVNVEVSETSVETEAEPEESEADEEEPETEPETSSPEQTRPKERDVYDDNNVVINCSYGYSFNDKGYGCYFRIINNSEEEIDFRSSGIKLNGKEYDLPVGFEGSVRGKDINDAPLIYGDEFLKNNGIEKIEQIELSIEFTSHETSELLFVAEPIILEFYTNIQ